MKTGKEQEMAIEQVPAVRRKSKASPSEKADAHFSLFSDFDIELFRTGRHFHLYNKLGAHIIRSGGMSGVYFSCWAPNAKTVSLIGNFNGWDRKSNVMNPRWDSSGIWEIFIPGISQGEYYKFSVESQNGQVFEKGDPYAYHWEVPPATGSIVWDLSYRWGDRKWMRERSKVSALEKPLSVYEMHPGSWRRAGESGERFMSYIELAEELPAYCLDMGFTHVELMPVMEHPFYGSWGYQLTGYFAPSSRYGTPQDFMSLVDALHVAGIGVILDWVPSHFPTDAFGPGYFDGTHLYEHDDPRKGFHPDWKSFIFNYSRNEVRSYLISSALFWLDKYHIDGLRVDGVASMLYLDYSREHGQWIPNEYGGRENLDAVHFLREFNEAVDSFHPDVITIAEESTAWPGVTQPVKAGGLGFDLKWMMGWMHDTLKYFEKEPIYRSYHHNQITFSMHYFFSEKFLLPFSHDEVVYGKHSMIGKMPGDIWQKFANLRLLYGYMFGHPGSKMLFMGAEFAQWQEWKHDFSLDWHDSRNPENEGIMKLVSDLNKLYRSEPAMHELDYSPEGFEWIDFHDHTNSVIAWIRKGKHEGDRIIFVANFTPVVRENYRIGTPLRGYYEEVLNTDNMKYGGSNVLNDPEVETAPIAKHGRTHSLSLTLPPLGIIALKWKRGYENLNLPSVPARRSRSAS